MEFFPPRAQLDAFSIHPPAGWDGRLHAHAFGSLIADTRGRIRWPMPVILQSRCWFYVAHPAHMLENPSVDVLKNIPSVLG